MSRSCFLSFSLSLFFSFLLLSGVRHQARHMGRGAGRDPLRHADWRRPLGTRGMDNLIFPNVFFFFLLFLSANVCFLFLKSIVFSVFALCFVFVFFFRVFFFRPKDCGNHYSVTPRIQPPQRVSCPFAHMYRWCVFFSVLFLPLDVVGAERIGCVFWGLKCGPGV